MNAAAKIEGAIRMEMKLDFVMRQYINRLSGQTTARQRTRKPSAGLGADWMGLPSGHRDYQMDSARVAASGAAVRP